MSGVLLVTVNITYDSLSKTLSVVVNDEYSISIVAQVIDLNVVFPEYFWVGLSATTTSNVQTHDVHSWSFTSTSEVDFGYFSENNASYA